MKKLRIKNILVPIDFSEMSIQTIKSAKKLARRFGAQIHLAHIQDAIYPAGFIASTPMSTGEAIAIQRQNETCLLKALRNLAATLDLPPGNCHVLTTAPAFDAICRLVPILSIDLVVMPTHGRTGLRRLFLGSTAERIVQHSPVPVWVVRKHGNGLNKILVPVDFSVSSLEALNYAIEFAKAVTAKIIVFHAVHPGYAFTSDGYAMYDLSEVSKALHKSAQQQMREFVQAAKFDGVKFETIIRLGTAVEHICAFAKAEDVDLITTATHGRTGFDHVLIGSIAEQVVRHADRAVLVVPSHPKIRLQRLATPTVREHKRIVCRVAAKPRRSTALSRRITKRNRKLLSHALPERRKTNKFRESHSA